MKRKPGLGDFYTPGQETGYMYILQLSKPAWATSQITYHESWSTKITFTA